MDDSQDLPCFDFPLPASAARIKTPVCHRQQQRIQNHQRREHVDSLGATAGGPDIWFTNTKTGFACGNNGGIWPQKCGRVLVNGTRHQHSRRCSHTCSTTYLPTPPRLCVGQWAPCSGRRTVAQRGHAPYTTALALMPCFFLTPTTDGLLAVQGALCTPRTVAALVSQISGTTEDLNCVFSPANRGFAAGGEHRVCLLQPPTAAPAGSWFLLLESDRQMRMVYKRYGRLLAAANGVYRTRTRAPHGRS